MYCEVIPVAFNYDYTVFSQNQKVHVTFKDTYFLHVGSRWLETHLKVVGGAVCAGLKVGTLQS